MRRRQLLPSHNTMNVMTWTASNYCGSLIKYLSLYLQTADIVCCVWSVVSSAIYVCPVLLHQKRAGGFQAVLCLDQLAPCPPGLFRFAVWLAIWLISLNTSRPESFSPPSLLSRWAAGSSSELRKGFKRKCGWLAWAAASCLGMMQSWTCFRCCFILSGRLNSFWHTGQGKTFLLVPSW